MSLVGQIVLSPARLREFPGLSNDAILRAIDKSVFDIREVAMIETPVRTGELAGSFDIASTPRTIVWKWDAPYAAIVEKGREDYAGGLAPGNLIHFLSSFGQWVRTSKGILGFQARNYGAAVAQRALEILKGYLAEELLAIGG